MVSELFYDVIQFIGLYNIELVSYSNINNTYSYSLNTHGIKAASKNFSVINFKWSTQLWYFIVNYRKLYLTVKFSKDTYLSIYISFGFKVII